MRQASLQNGPSKEGHILGHHPETPLHQLISPRSALRADFSQGQREAGALVPLPLPSSAPQDGCIYFCAASIYKAGHKQHAVSKDRKSLPRRQVSALVLGEPAGFCASSGPSSCTSARPLLSCFSFTALSTVPGGWDEGLPPPSLFHVGMWATSFT